MLKIIRRLFCRHDHTVHDHSDLIREIEIAEDKNMHLELDNNDLKTAINVLVDLYAGERRFLGGSYE